jgi:hypothetical protein
MKRLLAVAIILVLLPGFVFAEGEYDLELKDLEKQIEKKPYTFGGYLEYRPILFGLDKSASLYKLRYYDHSLGDTLFQNNGAVWLEGSYTKGIATLFAATKSTYTDSSIESTGKTILYTGYLSLKPSPSLTLDFGKKTMKWGKGYAWNPAAFIDRPKDPDDPELALEGYVVAVADYIKSFPGNLKTFSFTPVILPEYSSSNINDDFGQTDALNVAAKAYFLFYDTDIDFTALAGGSKTPRYGFDFSRNISTNLEVHGEFAYITHVKRIVIENNGATRQKTFDGINYLAGLRYLSARDTTYIFEYYHQGTGFTSQELSNYFTSIDKGYEAYVTRHDLRLLSRAISLQKGGYTAFTPGTDYLYLRISQKEPFDILYFTPAITSIYNIHDRSFQVTPELLYTPITNLELRLRTGLLVAGSRKGEFGEKPNDYRIELRMRYYF